MSETATFPTHSSRRTFLKQGTILAAGLALGLPWLSGCRKTPSQSDGIWWELAQQLEGSLLLPENYRGFVQKAAPWALQYAYILPQAIACCVSARDVQTCIRWARKHKMPLVARSGGHSYGGYSTTTGLMIDLSPMNQVTYEPGTGLLRVAGGARNRDVFHAGNQLGMAIPHGRCFGVGVAGLTLGGGIGFDMREHGYTCDKLVETEVVLANGDIITCNETAHSDLFWACRGAGGGNFGIHTSFSFKPYSVGQIVAYDIQWKGGNTAALLNASQQIIANAPRELGLKLTVLKEAPGAGNPLFVSLLGSLNGGNRVALEQLLQPMFAVQNPIKSEIREMGYWQGNEFISEEGLPEHAHERSRFINGYLTDAAIATIIEQLNAWPGTSVKASWKFFLLGGAIDDRQPEDMAMVHRGYTMLSSIDLEWSKADSAGTVAQAEQWLDHFHNQMAAYTSAHSYQNFIDPKQQDFLHAYYGQNLARLRDVKRKYDPENTFHYAQAIPL